MEQGVLAPQAFIPDVAGKQLVRAVARKDHGCVGLDRLIEAKRIDQRHLLAGLVVPAIAAFEFPKDVRFIIEVDVVPVETQHLCDTLGDEGLFAGILFRVVVDRVAGKPRAQFLCAHRGKSAGIDAARERERQRHVGAQPDFRGVAKEFLILGQELGKSRTRLPREIHAPEPLRPQVGIARPNRGVAGVWKSVHVLEYGRAFREGAERSILRNGGPRKCAGPTRYRPERRKVRCEVEKPVHCAPEQRLLPQVIAREEQFLRLSVPDGKGEHAVQIAAYAAAPQLVAFENDLRIALCAKDGALGFERQPQLPVVVDLAIENDDVASAVIRHRLVAAFQVDDRKPRMKELDSFAVAPLALGVTAAE